MTENTSCDTCIFNRYSRGNGYICLVNRLGTRKSYIDYCEIENAECINTEIPNCSLHTTYEEWRYKKYHDEIINAIKTAGYINLMHRIEDVE